MNPLQHIKLPGGYFGFIHSDGKTTPFNNLAGLVTAQSRIFSAVINAHETSMADAVIEWARAEGYTDVHLMDRDWVMAALREKLEREKEAKT